MFEGPFVVVRSSEPSAPSRKPIEGSSKRPNPPPQELYALSEVKFQQLKEGSAWLWDLWTFEHMRREPKAHEIRNVA